MSGCLTLIRLMAGGEEGLKLCPVTRPQFDLDTYHYSHTLLAEQIDQGVLRRFTLQLSEFDEAVLCSAYVLRDLSADFSTYVGETNGYSYAGYGAGASGFGYNDATTVAWLVPHREAPCVFWRQDDPIGEGRVNRWLNHKADQAEDGLVPPEHYEWPEAYNLDRTLVVPEELRLVTLNRRGHARSAGSY